MPVSRPATSVVVRSLLGTAQTVGFASFVHTRLGGHLPGPAQTLALAGIVLVGALALLSGRVRLWAVAPLVIGAQVALHEGFSRLAGTGHLEVGGHTAGAMPGMPAMPTAPTTDAGTSMLVAHLVIGVVAFLVLLCQEQAFHTLAGLIQVLSGASLPVTAPLRTRPNARPVSGLTTVLLAADPRRGPPRSLLLTP